MTAEKVLQFWFGAPPLRPNRKLWWGGKSQDAAIHENFSETVAAAVAGHLDSWRDEPRGALALVILLDQMTRNIYRGQPEAFSGDGRALEVTLHGLQQGYLEVYHPFETVFFLMPLEHDESMVSQDRCIAELDQLLQRCGSEQADMVQGCLDYAHQHREIIQRFGRYPHRNQVMGRASTPQEQEYLAAGGRRFGQ